MKVIMPECNCWLPDGDMERCPFHGPLLKKKEPHPEKVEVLGQAELRVKVAELRGWEEVVWASLDSLEGLPPLGHEYGRDSGHCQIPDYPNDLNACAEFEKGLKPIQRFEYANALEEALDLIPEGHGLGLREHRNFAYATATAEDRCRAFVAVMEAPSDPSGTEKQLADSSNPNS